ncbi:hypothetical protein SAMN05216326_12722 [Nitrosomonas marina]|uniref:Uncharacterized protein n=1 Tax=Nitrosomonas marina TaxID=917 RepID=A0A1I0EFY9_9PROT|nr:hypothetical protein [Nitrosomonas marina]SET44197.1 hypothetical protein SAMN05216326_12722 [Nitrosomonas marina]
MAINNAQYLKGYYDVTKAHGAKVISSDFAFEIEGFEQNYLLCKQVPWPELSHGGEIEIPMPLGTTRWQAQQAKVAGQGAISMFETVQGHIDNMLINLLTSGGYFNATIYEGTPQRFLKAKRIVDCFMQVDNPDRDWENRAQPLMFTGTLFFHYFGEIIPGNSSDYT